MFRVIRAESVCALLSLLLIASCASPQDLAEADRVRAQTRIDESNAQQDLANRQIREAIIIPAETQIEAEGKIAAARAEQARQEAEREERHAETLQNIETEGKQQRTEILIGLESQRADLSRQQAMATATSIAVVAFAIGFALFSMRLGGGAAAGINAWLTNWGQRINPVDGQFPALNRPEGIFLPGRVPGSHLLIGKPGLIERMAMALAYLHAVRSGAQADLPEPKPWVQIPTPDAVTAEITANDQRIGMLTAATRHPGSPANAQAYSAAVSSITGAAPWTFNVPTPIEIVNADEVIKQLEAS